MRTNNIRLILQREYLTRVKKKSFIIMTVLGPLLFAAITIIPIWLALRSAKTNKVVVLDESGLFNGKFEDKKSVKYRFIKGTLFDRKVEFLESEDDILLYIPPFDLKDPLPVQLFSKANPSLEVESGISKTLEKEIKDLKMKALNIDPGTVEKLKSEVDIRTILLNESGEQEGSSAAATIAGFAASFLIYIFIFMYGSIVMRGVIEEKTNRIVEVIISTVKPFELMMGKVLGVAFVGLTQFMLWIVLTWGITAGATAFLVDSKSMEEQSKEIVESTNLNQDMEEKAPSNLKVAKLLNSVSTLNIPLIVGCFLFYFLGGYLMYSALFAAVGAAVDNETDSQQFILPVTIPMILSMVLAQFFISNPDSSMAFWLSVFPLTSPVVMMIRLPFNPPVWEILLSMVMLVFGFVGTIWLAARIYRVGILMHGKKVNYKELSKWLFYKG
jgi:ABC-2 type transport system permease protein